MAQPSLLSLRPLVQSPGGHTRGKDVVLHQECCIWGELCLRGAVLPHSGCPKTVGTSGTSAFPNPLCRYPALSQAMLTLQGCGKIEEVETALRAGWWLLNLQGHPWEALTFHLPLPSWPFFAFCFWYQKRSGRHFASFGRTWWWIGGAKEAEGQSSSAVTASTSQGQQAHCKNNICSPARDIVDTIPLREHQPKHI